MTKEKSALVAAGHEPGAENGVRILSEKDLHHPQKILGMILKVGVMDDHHFGIYMQEARPNGRPFATVLFVTQPHPGDFARSSLRFNGATKALNGIVCAIG